MPIHFREEKKEKKTKRRKRRKENEEKEKQTEEEQKKKRERAKREGLVEGEGGEKKRNKNRVGVTWDVSFRPCLCYGVIKIGCNNIWGLGKKKKLIKKKK